MLSSVRRVKNRSLFVGVLLLTVSVSVAAQHGNVIGLPPQAVEHLPGVASLFDVPNASAPPRIANHPFVRGQVLARFPLALSDQEIDGVARISGAQRAERLSPLGLFLLHGPPSVRATERMMERLWESRTAVRIGANYLGEITYQPDDPHHVNGDQWYHEAPSDIDLDLRTAWDITRGSSDVVVAVVDTGIDIDHPEFLGRLYVNPGEIPGNGVDDDMNGYIDDVSGWNAVDVNGIVNDITVGHGTWVASILLANSDNAHQVAGFDHSAKVLPIKVLDQTTGHESFFVAGLDYLIMNPGVAYIVNMSVANYREFALVEDTLDALALSSIMIGGSGNDGDGTGQADIGFPESHPSVITVSGTDRFDDLAFFPITGTTAATGDSVDFSAPAVDIYTASWEDPDDPMAAHVGPGTSFSAPMVSGIASLGLSIRPTMTREDLIDALRETAVDLGEPGWDPEFGWGRVNAHDALVVLQTLIFRDGFETGDLTAWSSSSP